MQKPVRTQLVSPIWGTPTLFYYPTHDNLSEDQVINTDEVGVRLFLSMRHIPYKTPFVYKIAPVGAHIVQNEGRRQCQFNGIGAFRVLEKVCPSPSPVRPIDPLPLLPMQKKPPHRNTATPTGAVVNLSIVNRQPRTGSTFKNVSKYEAVFERLVKDGNGILCPFGVGDRVGNALLRWLKANGKEGYACKQKWEDGDMVFWRSRPTPKKGGKK